MKKSICILLVTVIMMTVLGTGCQKEKQTDTKQAVAADYTKGTLLKERLQVPETVQGVFSSPDVGWLFVDEQPCLFAS